MMKTIFKFFIYLIVFLTALFLFLPKEPLYNLLENQLQKNKIIISDEQREEKLFGIDIKKGDIYYEGINIANVNKLSFTSYLFYTNIHVVDIRLLDSLKNIVPTPINELTIQHSVLEFDKILINANGTFGEAIGFVDLLNRKVEIELEASSKMKSSYSKFLQNMILREGKYTYEYKF